MTRPMRHGVALALLLATPLAAQQAPRAVTLTEAIAAGRQDGVQAALARLSADVVGARVGQRQADLLPALTGIGQLSRQTVNFREFGFAFPGVPAVSDPFTLFRGKLAAEQLIFDKGVSDRLAAVKDSAIAAGLDADHAGDLSAAAAGMAWLRLAAADETVRARLDDSVTAAAFLEIAIAQVDAGTAPRIDRTRSETQLAAVRNQLAIARNARGRAAIDLARAMGLPPDSPLATSGDPADAYAAVPTSADAAVQQALAQRSDLRAERQRLVVAERQLAAARAAILPSLGASGLVQTSGTDIGEMYRTWSLGVGLTWPIFDGFRRERRTDEQRLRLDAEQVRLKDLAAQVEADARVAMLDLASANEQVALATERQRLAEEELSEARDRFAAGVAGSVETTNAQADVAAARDALIQARVNVGAAQISAARALGLLDNLNVH
jgi:outer membrane protein TolC